jgi:hypothetical protein
MRLRLIVLVVGPVAECVEAEDERKPHRSLVSVESATSL